MSEHRDVERTSSMWWVLPLILLLLTLGGCCAAHDAVAKAVFAGLFRTPSR